MAKLLFILLSIANVCFYSSVDRLEKAKEKYSNSGFISYTETAYYPLPGVDIVDSVTTFYAIYSPQENDFDYRYRRGDTEQFYQNGVFTEIRHDEKSYYRYEDVLNQNQTLKSSLLKRYGPIALLKHDWTYIKDTIINGMLHSNYSFIESSWEHEGKKIVVEYHIYISPNYSLSQFERKNFVDSELTQTVTYKFNDYVFEAEKSNLEYSIPEKYSLKFFERVGILKPLEKGEQAPFFEGLTINDNKISLEEYIGNRTVILFSATSCGYSQIVTDHISQPDFELGNKIKLINFLGSDSKERTIKYFERYEVDYPIIADRKDIETKYGISGYPILYLLDEYGTITESLSGSSYIIEFLDNLKLK